MTSRSCLLSMAFLLCLAAGLQAAERDPLVGIYQGAYQVRGGEPRDLIWKVIALGGGEYLGIAELSESGPRLEIPGTQVGEALSFRGLVNAGPSYGGSYEVEASLRAAEVRGEFSGVNAAGTFELTKTEVVSPTLGARSPQDAVVLFDGSGLDQWQQVDGSPPAWKLLPDGAMEVVKGSLLSKQAFGDAEIHLEFRTPFMPEARGQARGNSGVYMQGRYEVQILDSFGLEPKDNECGGIYEIAKPQLSACLPPLEWQTYDIQFRAPRFDPQGSKTADAVMTVRLNGSLIHNQVKVPRPTRSSIDSSEVAKGGLMLQDHGNPVQYRNVWVVER